MAKDTSKATVMTPELLSKQFGEESADNIKMSWEAMFSRDHLGLEFADRARRWTSFNIQVDHPVSYRQVSHIVNNSEQYLQLELLLKNIINTFTKGAYHFDPVVCWRMKPENELPKGYGLLNGYNSIDHPFILTYTNIRNKLNQLGSLMNNKLWSGAFDQKLETFINTEFPMNVSFPERLIREYLSHCVFIHKLTRDELVLEWAFPSNDKD